MPKSPNKKADKVLQGKIALVAGATRGAGRGIAIALGEAGATVYCTGRSSRRSTRLVPQPSQAFRKRLKKPPSSSPPPAAQASLCEWITLFQRK